LKQKIFLPLLEVEVDDEIADESDEDEDIVKVIDETEEEL
jgi:hypothetical protein